MRLSVLLPVALVACSPVNDLPRADGERFRRCQAFLLASSCREGESGGDCARRLAHSYSEAPEAGRAGWAASMGCPESIAGGSSRDYNAGGSSIPVAPLEAPAAPPEVEVNAGRTTRGEATLTLVVRADFATVTLTGTPASSRSFLSLRVQWNAATFGLAGLRDCTRVGLAGGELHEGRPEQDSRSRMVSATVALEEVQRALSSDAAGVRACERSAAFTAVQRTRAREFLARWQASP